MGTPKGVGWVYLHTVVAPLSSYVFEFLHTSKLPEAAVAVLHNKVLPFYQLHTLPVAQILTDNGQSQS